MDKIDIAIANRKGELAKKPNFTGIAKGYKITGGKLTSEVAIIVFVDKKVPLTTLSLEDQVPPEVEGIKTDIQERVFKVLRTQRFRPAPGGCSVGNYRISVGTLGVNLWQGIQKIILSNYHVLVGSSGQLRDNILQPGGYDGGQFMTDTVAQLSDFETIKTDEGTENIMDAAIAIALNQNDLDEKILDIGKPTGFSELQLGDIVHKSSRTSVYNEGKVIAIGAEITVGGYNGSQAKFVNQIIIDDIREDKGFALPGDSGSSLLKGTEIGGLIFAGDGDIGVANPIMPIIERFKLTVDRVGPPPQPTPSQCKWGNSTAHILNIWPRVARRRGRFFYLNP